MKSPERAQLKIVDQKEVRVDLERERKQLQAKDEELRRLLEETLFDDAKFQDLVLEMARNLQDAGSSAKEGIDRARAVASFAGLLRQLKKTQRFRMGREFMEVGRAREINMRKAQTPRVNKMSEAS